MNPHPTTKAASPVTASEDAYTDSGSSPPARICRLACAPPDRDWRNAYAELRQPGRPMGDSGWNAAAELVRQVQRVRALGFAS